MAKATRPVQYDKAPQIERDLLKRSERVYPTGNTGAFPSANVSAISGTAVGGSMSLKGASVGKPQTPLASSSNKTFPTR